MDGDKSNISHTCGKTKLRPLVFWPAMILIGGATAFGIVNGTQLTEIFSGFFNLTLDRVGWLYQLSMFTAFIVVGIMTFSKIGRTRFGGDDAKAEYSFLSYFAMTFTGGVGTGILTYGVVQPVIFAHNIYGELNGYGIEAGTMTSSIFSLARVFHDWTFIPYSSCALFAAVLAFMCFNKKKPLSTTSTLVPLFGDRITKGSLASIVDCLCIIAVALCTAGSLGGGILLIASGLDIIYGIDVTNMLLFIITATFTIAYMYSAIKGMKKGIKKFANISVNTIYVVLALLLILGPTKLILNNTLTSIGYWLNNIFEWSLDAGPIGGEALVKWWNLNNWAYFIAYSPILGIFLANISYGRTVREFMVVNWILPSAFSILWFGIWGFTALEWQSKGTIDLVGTIGTSGAVGAFFAFIQKLPLSTILAPFIILTILLSFSTLADGIIKSIGQVCIKETQFNKEPAWIKVVCGLLIATIAFILIAYTKGDQGLEGIKYLGSAGGAFGLAIFVLVIFSAIKLFFIDRDSV